MSDPYETLRVERDGHLAEVVLCRPDKGNAMNAALFGDLEAAFQRLDADEEVRAVILRGEGDDRQSKQSKGVIKGDIVNGQAAGHNDPGLIHLFRHPAV